MLCSLPLSTPYRFPVSDEVPSVTRLIFRVVQVGGVDAVLFALLEVPVDVASDASLGEAVAQGTKSSDDANEGLSSQGSINHQRKKKQKEGSEKKEKRLSLSLSLFLPPYR